MGLMTPERRVPSDSTTRGRLRIFWDILFAVVRWLARRAHGVYLTFGVFLLSGIIVAVGGTWLFARLAGHVESGGTQAFDDAVLTWVGQHRTPMLDAAMVEITSLGTGLVVMATVVVAALFLWLTRHRHSAILLGVATAGGLVLNGLLKAGFGRPRPEIIDWGTHVVSSSFPSGHAMNAVIVYGTVAYLGARLQRRYATRVATLAVAAIVIVLICASRVYLGVHYPSDVLAGIVVGLAWAGFCMATLEAVELYARYNAPQLLRDERPAPAPGAHAPPEGT